MSEPSASIPTSTLEYYQALPVPEWTAPRPRYWLHGLLLAATCFTTLVVGARMQFNFSHNLAPFATGDELIPFFPVGWVLEQPARLLMGIPFSATLLLILLAHEMGHYLFCRRYGVWATLPFFLPAPTLIGTLGAVIRIKGPIRSRAALFDIGIAGPIAGFAVAVSADLQPDTRIVQERRACACSRCCAVEPSVFASNGDRCVGWNVCHCV